MEKYKFKNYLLAKELKVEIFEPFVLATALAANKEPQNTSTAQKDDTAEFISKASSELKGRFSDKEKHLYGYLIRHGMRPFYADYLVNFININDVNIDEIKGDVTKNDIEFYRKLRFNILPIDDFIIKEPKLSKEQVELLKPISEKFSTSIKTSSFGPSKTFEFSDITNNNVIHYIVYNEKYKVFNDIGDKDLMNFLNKYNIKWGDMDSLNHFLNLYQRVLKVGDKKSIEDFKNLLNKG